MGQDVTLYYVKSLRPKSMLSAVIRFLVVVAIISGGTSYSACDSACSQLCGRAMIRKVLWVTLILLTVCSASENTNIVKRAADRKTCRRGTIIPRDPCFLLGQNITLLCNRRDGGHWNNLTFRRGQHSDVVPRKYIHKYNETTIKLEIPVTMEEIENTKESMQYRCVHRKKEYKCYDDIYLSLDYYPLTPANVSCRVYDFDTMTCTWSLGVEFRHENNVDISCKYEFTNDDTADLYYKSDNSMASWATCPHQNSTACYWNSSEYMAPVRVYVQVRVSYTRFNITKETQVLIFNMNDIIEPGPVIGISMNRTTVPRCVELDWRPSDGSWYRYMKFSVTYKSACTTEMVKGVKYDGKKTVLDDTRLCGLNPSTKYTYFISGQMMEQKGFDNKTFIPKGFWSKPAVLVKWTDSDVLDVNPVTYAGLYEISSISSPGMGGYDLLTLYWTPLSDCDLHDHPDNVKYYITACNISTSVQHPEFSTQIGVPNHKVLNISLLAGNSVGSPEGSTVVTIFPALYAPAPSELIVEYNKTNRSCVTVANIVVKENGTGYSDIFHTVIWCIGTQQSCQEPVKWKKLMTNATLFKLPGNQCNEIYRYGLVTHGYHKGQGLSADTGIHWEPCIYQAGKVPDEDKPVRNVHLTTMAPDKGFTVEWTPYDCKTKAYITHYSVTYCTGDGKETCKCLEDRVMVNVSRQSNSYTASGLNVGSRVCVWVRGISKAGMGPPNTKSISLTISEREGTIGVFLIVLLIGAVICVAVIVVWKFLRMFFSCVQQRFKKAKDNTDITLPRDNLTVDERQFGQDNEYDSQTSGNGTASGFRDHYTSQYTITAEVTNSSESAPLIKDKKNNHVENDSDRKYSVRDISDALNETCVDKLDGYKQPTDIDSVESEQESARAEHKAVRIGKDSQNFGNVPRSDKSVDAKSISSTLSEVDSFTEERSLDKSDSVQLIEHPPQQQTKWPNNRQESIELKDMESCSDLAPTHISQENTEEEETKISLEQLTDHSKQPIGYHGIDSDYEDNISDSVSDSFEENVTEQTNEKFKAKIEPNKPCNIMSPCHTPVIQPNSAINDQLNVNIEQSDSNSILDCVNLCSPLDGNYKHSANLDTESEGISILNNAGFKGSGGSIKSGTSNLTEQTMCSDNTENASGYKSVEKSASEVLIKNAIMFSGRFGNNGRAIGMSSTDIPEYIKVKDVSTGNFQP